MSEYEKLAWEWQNRDDLAATLAMRAERSGMWHREVRRAVTHAGLKEDWINGRVDIDEVLDIKDAITRQQQEMLASWDGTLTEPEWWLTVEELAEEFALSVNTMKRHASKVSDDDKRMRQTGADRQYAWKWDSDGKFDESKYDPPGWRAYRKFSQSKNRDGDKRMPEAFRGHGQSMDGRRDAKPFAPTDRRSTSHGGMVGDQAEMLVHDESLYSVDPGLAPRQDKGQQVKEYRLSAVREVIEARKPTAGRFTKRAGRAE